MNKIQNIYLFSMNIISKSPNKTIYCCDYLNLFSDYREIKYKKSKVDFHKVKYDNKEKDTVDFFKLFFTKYIKRANININGNFIFVMKKITNYDNIIYKILDIYDNINIRFVIIESKYENNILDKNKDDFLCQYISKFLMLKNNNCILISNDKYRDRNLYIQRFSLGKAQYIKVVHKQNGSILIHNLQLLFEDSICISLPNEIYKRSVIPKNKLFNII